MSNHIMQGTVLKFHTHVDCDEKLLINRAKTIIKKKITIEVCVSVSVVAFQNH